MIPFGGSAGSENAAPFPPALTAIAFDLDATLYYQRRLRVWMLAKLLSGFIAHPLQQLQVVKFLTAYRVAHENLRGDEPDESIDKKQLRLACAQAGIAVPLGQAILAKWFFEIPCTILSKTLRPGGDVVLSVLRSFGYRLGLYSDYPAVEKLKALELLQFFDAVVSSQDGEVNALKPNPKGLLVCLEKLGAQKENSLYVGDRADVDGECAKEAGVHSVIIGSGAAPPGSTLIGDLRDLIPLVQGRATSR